MKRLLVLFIVTFIEAKKTGSDDLVAALYPGSLGDNEFNQPLPVFFGHIYKDGYGDPTSDLKQPIDLLELSLKMPRTEAEKRMYLKQKSPKDIIYIKNPSTDFPSPRDEYQYYVRHRNKDKLNIKTNKSSIDDTPRSFDFEFLQTKNILSQPKRKTHKPTELPKLETYRLASFMGKPKYDYFAKNNFLIDTNNDDSLNWTTCEQFGYDLQFHPKDIIDLDWVPFFTWSSRPHIVAFVHRFSYPTVKTVTEYKTKYGPYLDTSINWEEPKLMLKENQDYLLIAINRKGTFYAVPNQKLSEGPRRSLPVIKIQLKVIDPYLAMMYCDGHYATVMAVSGDEPTNDYEKKMEAAKINITGIGYSVARDFDDEKLRLKIQNEWKAAEENMKYIRSKEGASFPKERFF